VTGAEDDGATERWVRVARTEWTGASASADDDLVVREEPLEIRIGASPIAVVMRTPGHDLELVRGFLIAERIVDGGAAIRSIRHCDRVDDPEAEDNVVRVTLDASVPVDLARLRRNMYASSSCGICGRATVDDLLTGLSPLHDDRRIEPEVLYALPERLRLAQDVFELTGGLHGAGLFDAAGRALVVREDIGRHNAVDKAVGWASLQSVRPAILMVSGRVSFEIVQKALAAGIPFVAAVSAPSSLAVDLAQRGGITLIGFVRGSRMCVYAHEQRVRAPDA